MLPFTPLISRWIRETKIVIKWENRSQHAFTELYTQYNIICVMRSAIAILCGRLLSTTGMHRSWFLPQLEYYTIGCYCLNSKYPNTLSVPPLIIHFRILSWDCLSTCKQGKDERYRQQQLSAWDITGLRSTVVLTRGRVLTSGCGQMSGDGCGSVWGGRDWSLERPFGTGTTSLELQNWNVAGATGTRRDLQGNHTIDLQRITPVWTG